MNYDIAYKNSSKIINSLEGFNYYLLAETKVSQKINKNQIVIRELDKILVGKK